MSEHQINHHNQQTLVFSLANGLTNGGVTTWAMNTCQRMAAKGQQALILAHRAATGQQELTAKTNIRIVRCNINASETQLTPAEIKESSRCYESIPDPVYFPNWSWGTWSSVATILRNPAKPCRVIGIAHTDESSYYSLLIYYESIISKFIAVSNAIEQRLIQELPTRRHDIVRLSYPLAIKTGQIRGDHPRQELRIGYAGRIQDYQKRISDLKSLVSKLSTLPGNYCFEIAGDGTHLPELMAFFDTNHYDNITIRFHGLIESVNMPDFWSNIDVAILFSSHEGLSISMIESMAAGCVQMVTNVSGVSDSVVHGIRGFIHEVGDTTAMANHLQLLHDNPEQLRLMSEACINHVRRHHDPDHYDDILLSLTRQAWEQPQRYWPRFKRRIPPEVSAGFRNKNRVNHNISLKGRIKMKILRMINAFSRNDSNIQN